MVELIFKEEVFAIVGAAIEVHKELGPGFLEPVYHEAMILELPRQKVPFQSEVELSICYKQQPLEQKYRADFVCFDQIIVELKALQHLSGKEEAQVLNYLKATGLRVGVLINFGSQGKLEWKRLVR
jgi:GxxExxY protein